MLLNTNKPLHLDTLGQNTREQWNLRVVQDLIQDGCTELYQFVHVFVF